MTKFSLFDSSGHVFVHTTRLQKFYSFGALSLKIDIEINLLTYYIVEMPKYLCQITGNVSEQKSHHDSHLKSVKYKQAVKIFTLELEKLSQEEQLEKYGKKSDSINRSLVKTHGTV